MQQSNVHSHGIIQKKDTIFGENLIISIKVYGK